MAYKDASKKEANRISYLSKQKNNERRYYLENKQKIAERLKLAHDKLRDLLQGLKDVPCVDCGERYPSCAMDFDHVRGVKAFRIGSVSTKSLDRVLEEVAKCDIVCSNCHRERTHRRRLEARTAVEGSKRAYKERRGLLRELKDVPCTDCGGCYPPWVMDFDHVRGTKDFGVGPSWYKPIEVLLGEIAKCEVVCSNCHRERTYQRRNHALQVQA